jgi:hypothetical protein
MKLFETTLNYTYIITQVSIITFAIVTALQYI